jgi:large subunit ribosomal protein L23
MKKIDGYDVIISPVVTEKSTMASQFNKVVFNVKPGASKTEIKAAVEQLFDVKVRSVNTLVRKGKLKQFRGFRSIQSDTKKAVVTLEAGHTIDVTAGI